MPPRDGNAATQMESPGVVANSPAALAEFIGKAWVRCVEKDLDRYKRIVAVCYLGKKSSYKRT